MSSHKLYNEFASVLLCRAATAARTLVLFVFCHSLYSQSPCPASAVVDRYGNITVAGQGIVVLNECFEVQNNSFISSLHHVRCKSYSKEYILMMTDLGRVYHFQLPFQNTSYFSSWCGSPEWDVYYQQIKNLPYWRHEQYQVPCGFVRSNGDKCSRQSERSLCWQHR